jgi:hypothetical protein
MTAFKTKDLLQNAAVHQLNDGSYALATVTTYPNGEAASASGGDASAANQTAVQANAGSNASKAVAVQGVASGVVLRTYSPQMVEVRGDFASINGANAAGKTVGTLITIATTLGANTKVTLFDLSMTLGGTVTSAPNVIFTLFDEDPTTGSTFTDNSNTVIAAAAQANVLRQAAGGVVAMAAGGTGPAFIPLISPTLPVECTTDAGGNIYLVVTSNGTMTITSPVGKWRALLRTV